jgi:hypothetical protein
MATANASTVQRLERLGTGLLSPELGLAALDALIDVGRGTGGVPCDWAVMTVSPFDWPRLLKQQPAAVLDSVLSELAGIHPTHSVGSLPSAATTATSSTPGACRRGAGPDTSVNRSLDVAALEAGPVNDFPD